MEYEMVGWYPWLSGDEFEQAPWDGDGQGSAAVHGVAKSQTWLRDWTTTALSTSTDVIINPYGMD